MKRRAAKVASPAQPPATPEPRERLREFADFIQTQDPVALASVVTEPHGTLMRCSQIESFLRKYKRVLKARVVH